MRSMTGFGQARGEDGRHAVAVRIRAVNGRFLDLQIRMREEYRAAEPVLREELARELHRGRVEVTVEIRPLEEPRSRVEVHRGLIRAIHDATEGLVSEGLVEGHLELGELLRIPEAIQVLPEEESWEPGDTELVVEVTRRAAAEVVAARELEGAKLAEALAGRLDRLTEVARCLEPLAAAATREAGEALRSRLEELLGDVPVDPDRLAQEVALLADKSDVREELDRLQAHLEHFREVVARPGPVGKRLDFLTQEIFREITTLGAKGRNSAITRAILDAKGLSEQLREQIQNIE